MEGSVFDETFDEAAGASTPGEDVVAARRLLARMGRLLVAPLLAARVDIPSVWFVLTGVLNGFLVRLNVVNDAVYPKAFLCDLGVYAFFASIGFLLGRRARLVFYAFFIVFFGVLLFLDSVYFRSHNSVLSMFLIPQLKFLGEVSDAAVALVRWTDLFFLLTTAGFVVGLVALRRRGLLLSGPETWRARRRKMLTALIAFFVIFGAFAAIISKTEASRVTKQWNRPYIVEHFGAYTFHLSDLAKYFASKPTTSPICPQDYSHVVSFYERRNATPAQANAYTGLLDGQNVVVIHAESVQSMFMFKEFRGQEITPNLNRIARGGLYFDNFHAQQSSGTSSDSEFTLATSLFPINNGTVFISHYNNTFVSLPGKLKEKGYTAVAMHGNHGDFWNRELMNRTLGYDRYYSKKDFEIDEVVGMGLSDVSFFRQGAAILDELDRPFYATLIMLSNHTPFDDVEKYGEFDSGQFEGTRFGDYLKSLHYADMAIGRLFEDLERRGMLENTALVFYGDHHASLGREETAEFMEVETLDVYDHRRFRNVPFIVWSKRIDDPEVVHKPMGMIDIFPTLGNMLGVSNPIALGVDVFSVEKNQVAFPDGSWLDEDVIFLSSNMKYKVFGERMISDYKRHRCARAGVDGLENLDDVEDTEDEEDAGETTAQRTCEDIPKKRVYAYNAKRQSKKGLGGFAHDHVTEINDKVAAYQDISTLILDHNLLAKPSAKRALSIAHLAK